MFTGSYWGGKMNFMGAKNVSFRANGVLTFSMVYELLKEKKEKKNSQKIKVIKPAASPSAYYKLTFCL